MSTRYFTNSFCRRDQEQYAKKLKMPAGSLKELKRAYLDVNFYNLAEIRALSRKFGKISAMCLTQIYLAMSAAEGARIDEDAILDILENAEIENIAEFIPYCLEKSLIKLFREKIGDESQKTTIISESKTGLPDIDNDYDNNLKLEILHPEFQDPKIKQAIGRWVTYKRNNGKHLNQGSVDSLQSLYAGRAHDLPGDIDHSIASGWKNISPMPRNNSPGKQKLSSAERNLEATKEALRQIKEEIQL